MFGKTLQNIICAMYIPDAIYYHLKEGIVSWRNERALFKELKRSQAEDSPDVYLGKLFDVYTAKGIDFFCVIPRENLDPKFREMRGGILADMGSFFDKNPNYHFMFYGLVAKRAGELFARDSTFTLEKMLDDLDDYEIPQEHIAGAVADECDNLITGWMDQNRSYWPLPSASRRMVDYARGLVDSDRYGALVFLMMYEAVVQGLHEDGWEKDLTKVLDEYRGHSRILPLMESYLDISRDITANEPFHYDYATDALMQRLYALSQVSDIVKKTTNKNFLKSRAEEIGNECYRQINQIRCRRINLLTTYSGAM